MFAQPFVQAQIKENIKAPHHWPLWGESTGHLCIPLTKGNVAISWHHNDDASRLANGDTRLQAVVTLAYIKAGNSVMWYHLWNPGPWAEEINKFLLATLLLVKLWTYIKSSWRLRAMEALSASLAFCKGNPPWCFVNTGGFPSQRAVGRNFFFVISLSRLLNKQSSYWRFDTPWRSCVVTVMIITTTQNHISFTNIYYHICETLNHNTRIDISGEAENTQPLRHEWKQLKGK